MSGPVPGARRGWLVGGGLAMAATGLGAWVGWRRLGPADAADEAVALLLAQSLPDAAGQPPVTLVDLDIHDAARTVAASCAVAAQRSAQR